MKKPCTLQDVVPIYLLILCHCAPVAADEGLCVYSISGAYGPTSRFLYYPFLLIPIVLRNQDWLIGGTLGASMLFSSITAIHAIALAAVRSRKTTDLDTIPAFAITGVAMLAGPPMLIWSKTLRNAASSVRALVFSWICIMFAGSLASIVSVMTVPRPRACDGPSLREGSCGLACNARLPMRSGHSIIWIPYLWKEELFAYSGLFAVLGIPFLILSLVYAFTIMDLGPMESRGTSISAQRRAKNEGICRCCGWFIPLLGLALALAHIIVLELIMLGPHHVPLGEGLDAIGQWGTLVGAFFAIVAAVMKALVDKREPRSSEPVGGQRPGDPEMNNVQTHHPGLEPN